MRVNKEYFTLGSMVRQEWRWVLATALGRAVQALPLCLYSGSQVTRIGESIVRHSRFQGSRSYLDREGPMPPKMSLSHIN